MRQNGLWDWVVSRYGSEANEACSLSDLVLDLDEAVLSFKSIKFSPKFFNQEVKTTLRSGEVVSFMGQAQGEDTKGYEAKAVFTLNPTRKSFNFASDPESLATWHRSKKSLLQLETRLAREHEKKVAEAKLRIPKVEKELDELLAKLETVAGEPQLKERAVERIEGKIVNREVWLRDYRETLNGRPKKPPQGYYREVRYPTNVAPIALSSIVAGLDQEASRYMDSIGVLPKKPTSFIIQGFLEVTADWK